MHFNGFQRKSRHIIVLGISLLFCASISVICYCYFATLEDQEPSIPHYQWKPEYGELNGPDIKFDDQKVVEKLKSRFLVPPPPLSIVYNLNTLASEDPSMGQSDMIKKFFPDPKYQGFFIECGALDGETRSNSLYFERNLHWNGLLIEADLKNYEELVKRRRKAWISNSCLSTQKHPMMVSFLQNRNQGKISEFSAGYIQKGYIDVQCFPFNSYLKALNVSTVDYFSLDVEGNELEILQTIDFNSILIKTLSVEFIHDVEGKDRIAEFMKSQGYFVQGEVTHEDWLANDFIFVYESWYNQLDESIRDYLDRKRSIYKSSLKLDKFIHLQI